MEIRGIESGSSPVTPPVQERNDAAAAKPKQGEGAEAPAKPAPAGAAEGGKATGPKINCPACGASIPADSQVCGKCGAKVQSSAEKLADKLQKSLSDANYTDNGVGTLSALQRLSEETPENGA